MLGDTMSPHLPKTPPKMFETRSQAWQEVGLLHQVTPRAAKRARVEGLVLAVLFVVVVVLYEHRMGLLGVDTRAARPKSTRSCRSSRSSRC